MTQATVGLARLPDQGVAKTLFAGKILHANVFPYPRMAEAERETLEPMLDAIDAFLADKREEFRRWDLEAGQPPEFVQELRELGLFGLIIP